MLANERGASALILRRTSASCTDLLRGWQSRAGAGRSAQIDHYVRFALPGIRFMSADCRRLRRRGRWPAIRSWFKMAGAQQYIEQNARRWWLRRGFRSIYAACLHRADETMVDSARADAASCRCVTGRFWNALWVRHPQRRNDGTEIWTTFIGLMSTPGAAKDKSSATCHWATPRRCTARYLSERAAVLHQPMKKHRRELRSLCE